MNNIDLDRERRKQRRLEIIGSNNPICPTCGENDWRCIELHHIAGRSRCADTLPLCANCHRKVTDDQKDHPGSNVDGDPWLDRVGHFLLGLADLLAMAVTRLREFGSQLIALAAAAPGVPLEQRS